MLLTTRLKELKSGGLILGGGRDLDEPLSRGNGERDGVLGDLNVRSGRDKCHRHHWRLLR